MKHRRGGTDGGYATVWVVSAMAVVVAAAAAAIGFGLVLVARHRVANSADSAALAAASDAVAGAGAACAAARDLSTSNGVRVTACELDGPVATVTVVVTLPGPLAAFGPAVGEARAGPSSAAEVGPAG